MTTQTTFGEPEIVDSRRPAPVSDTVMLQRIRVLAELLDNKFVIPGTNQRIGLDGLIGLIPVAGDLITFVISSYIIYLARSLDVPKWVLARMVWNVLIDTGVGAIPVAGDLFDVAWKANLKNVKLLEKHLVSRGASRRGQT